MCVRTVRRTAVDVGAGTVRRRPGLAAVASSFFFRRGLRFSAGPSTASAAPSHPSSAPPMSPSFSSVVASSSASAFSSSIVPLKDTCSLRQRLILQSCDAVAKMVPSGEKDTAPTLDAWLNVSLQWPPCARSKTLAVWSSEPVISSSQLLSLTTPSASLLQLVPGPAPYRRCALMKNAQHVMPLLWPFCRGRASSREQWSKRRLASCPR